MLESIWKRILRRRGLSPWLIPAVILWCCSRLYLLGYYLIRKSPEKAEKVSKPVVSVGNITVGGTGKTPTVAMLARQLLDENIGVGIVSSGYGRVEKDRALLEPGYTMQNLPVSSTGDEVSLLAELIPEAIFSVQSRKLDAARALAEHGEVDLIIVDDGFQHTQLHRDVDIVTFDAAVSSQHLHILPFGLLREPLSVLNRADIVIFTRTSFARELGRFKEIVERLNPDAPKYLAQFVPNELIGRVHNRPLKFLEDKSVFLFAGVGNFKPLEQQVETLCAELDYAWELSDHQKYDDELLQQINEHADRLDSDVILTTGKDWVKLGSFAFTREIYYLAQTVDLDPGEEKLTRQLIQKLNLT